MNESRFVYPEAYRPCLVCGGGETSLWAEAGVFRIVRCVGCGFVWVNPYFSPDQLKALYQGYIQERLGDGSFKQRDRQYLLDRDFVLQFIGRGRMLDIGCSGGFFLNAFGEAFERYGIDVDAESVRYAAAHYPFGGNIRQAQLHEAAFPDAFFDLIVIRGVIQYIHDLDVSIGNASRMLKPGGLLYVCATPNIEAFAANLYREKWSLLNPAEHLFQFSPATLSRFLAGHGYTRVAMDFPYWDSPYCDVDRDHARVLEAVRLAEQGRRVDLPPSPPFWGNMMNIVFRKTGNAD